MKKLFGFGLLNNLSFRLKNYTKSIVFEGIGLTILLSFVFLLLFSNFIRVVRNGRYNYETYLYEKEGLTSIQDKNQTLKDHLAYTQSEEYKKLLARETLGLGDGSESLFKTQGEVKFFDETPDYLQVVEKEEFNDWWRLFINF